MVQLEPSLLRVANTALMLEAIYIQIFKCAFKRVWYVVASKPTDRHTDASCNAVPLVWGSLRLAPTKRTYMGLAVYCSSISISIEREHRLRPLHHLMRLFNLPNHIFHGYTAACYIVSGALGGSGVVVGIQGVKASDNSVSALLL